MKIFLLSIALFSAFIISSCNENSPVEINITDQSDRKVLFELFSNTRCTVCPPANSYLDSIHSFSGITASDTNVVILRVHTTLYSGDPFYDFNPVDNFARQDYYNAGTSNPRGFLMGASSGSFNSKTWTNLINSKFDEKRNFELLILHTFDQNIRLGNVTVKISQTSGNPVSDLALHIALAENEITYNAPNGETNYHNIMRDLITSPEGDSVSVTQGNTFEKSFVFSVNSALDITHLDLIVFIQSRSGKEVFAVDKKKLVN